MERTYQLGLYEKAMPKDLSWREKLGVAKQVGYDYVEMSIDDSEEKIQRAYMSKEERRSIVEVMYETELPIRSMCVSALTKYSIGNSDDIMRNRGMEIAEASIELAKDLGIRLVMIPGYDVYYEESTKETQEYFNANLKKVSLIAAKHGVNVGLETMENSFMNTVWKAMYYVKQINSPYLGIYPDLGNIKNAAVSLCSNEIGDLTSGAGHIFALHLKETIPGKFREIPYGNGHVDFKKNLETAWKLGIRKYVTEFWYVGNHDWKDEIVKAYGMATEILTAQEKANENK